MELYHQLKTQVRKQLKGHFWFLYGWVVLISILCFGIQQLALLCAQPSIQVILRLVLSLLCVIINSIMLFIFILRVRDKKFKGADIHYAFSKGGNIMFASLLISLVNISIQTTIQILLPIVSLALLCSVFVQFFFVCWYVLLAFMVYDHQVEIKELCLKPLRMMRHHVKTLLLVGGYYVLWNLLLQIAIQYILAPELMNRGVEAILHTQTIASIPLTTIAFVGVLFYLVQFVILVFLHMYLANFYEQQRYQ